MASLRGTRVAGYLKGSKKRELIFSSKVHNNIIQVQTTNKKLRVVPDDFD